MAEQTKLTGVERFFQDEDIIVSKTDTRGCLAYTNSTFLSISGYTEAELLGKAHNIIRHPNMPRCVFRYMWQQIAAGEEVFAYVVNRCKNGDHYWVFAHVTPTFDMEGRITGYHSSRRVPNPDAVKAVGGLYQSLCAIENRRGSPGEQWAASLPVLEEKVAATGMAFNEWMFELSKEGVC